MVSYLIIIRLSTILFILISIYSFGRSFHGRIAKKKKKNY